MKKLFLLLAVAMLSLVNLKAQNYEVNPNIKYNGDISLGLGAGTGDRPYGRIYLQTVQGVQFSEYFSAGVGIGVTTMIYDIEYDYFDNGFFMPLFIDVKGYLPVSKKTKLFAALDAGVNVALNQAEFTRFILTPSVGVSVSDRWLFSLGYEVFNQNLSVNVEGLKVETLQSWDAVVLKVGLKF